MNSKLNSKTVFYILLGILGLVVLGAIAGTLYGTGMLEKTGNTLLERKLEESVLEKDEQALAQAKRDIEQYNELEQVAKAIVPQEKDQARTVRELVAIANQAGIRIDSITFPPSTLGQAPAKGSKQPTGPTGTTQLTPVEGLSGVYSMPISVEIGSAVTYDQLLGFLRSLEQNRRTSHVTNISITPDQENRALVNFSLQINAYIKP
jgi:hypothetical protein